jgi:alkanesulfonate monooxygenase SsuD/methylene tetrahydromethanopterin reductase-like flavin-dependent oxidoreductase (luciferase family)
VVEEGAARTGRTPSRSDWRIAREVYVADTTERAREEALNGPFGESFIRYWMYLIGNGPRGTAAFKIDPEMSDEELTPEYMLENFWIVGDPDECTRQIRDLYDEVGGFGVLLPQTHDWGRDRAKWDHSMELMATEILPGLKDLQP